MSKEEIVERELSKALSSMIMCVPYLQEMNGKIPQGILNMLDEINKYSVMF